MGDVAALYSDSNNLFALKNDGTVWCIGMKYTDGTTANAKWAENVKLPQVAAQS